MTENEKAPSGATAKPCQVSDADNYDFSTATTVDNAFDLAIGIVTDYGTVAGQFTGGEDDKAQLVQLVAAQAGWRDLFRDYQSAKAEVSRLKSFNAELGARGGEQAGLINELLGEQKALRERIAELESKDPVQELRVMQERLKLAALQQTADRARDADTPIAALDHESPEARAERLYAAKDARGTRIEIRLY